ncbi:DNA-processing protein DprA [Aldersonia sp. NBC_00410]|uniref:DNA-processing protein DprA n=1 Tax=Aldersonia sp. NBC_00410 TaxID=2975954 RepID=UPI002259F7D9|nr:DNA-processing protein DprA [Aldersonia sp. NBC_00410]MCX5046204.1 DNA-processing protein DprA [Aldersonia sp. NBC_00410]
MSAVDVRRRAWAYLSRVAEGPCAPLIELIEAVGVLEAARAVRDWDLPEVLRRRTAARRHLDTAEHDLDLVARMRGRLVTPDDDEWPAWRMLAFAPAAREAAGPVTRECAPPLALWVLGSASLSALTDRAMAVVGTRAPSPYGEHAAGELAGGLAGRGWTVVSGAALGIDGAAHRAALSAGAASIAVLACGIDQSYPAQHSRLLAEIVRDGLVVSEYPPGVTPARHRFLTRNRMVAALSDAVVVVEAGRRSGARNTAGWARRLGRPALAVPGPITSATSVGCHRMIRDGEARLVSCADDILDEAGPLTLPMAIGQSDTRATDELRGDQLLVYEALPAAGSRGPRELSESSGVALADVRSVLPQLEIAGFVGVDETGWFRVSAR